MSGESFSISLLLRHNFPVNRNAFGESFSFEKESARSALADDLWELVVLDWLLNGGRKSMKGPGVCGAESQDEELVVALVMALLFSKVAEFSGGIEAVALRSVF